jgi:Tol biopolymer transport system component
MRSPHSHSSVQRQVVGVPIKTLLAVAISAGLLAACGGSDNNDSSTPPSTSAPQINQLNTLKGSTKDVTVELREGTNMAAAPSPDGQRIVFSAQGALWVIPVAGGPATRITSWDLEPTAPVWSPDGKTIAFQNYAPEGNYHMWTVSPDGNNPVEITAGPNDDREPAWLPDGSGLVFSSDRSNDGQYKIWSVTLSNKALSQLTKGAGAESNPVVSPDGKQLAYVDSGNVFTAPINGSAAPTKVAAGIAPAWNPAGSGLVYQTPALALVVSGKEVSSNEDLFPFPARYLPDGGFLYTADGKIRMRDAAGANPKDIPFTASLTLRRPVITATKDRGFSNTGPRPVMGISAPALSPDGKSIAFVALNDVWVMTIGQAPVRLTNDTDRDGSPQWTPDGSAVYFSSEKNNAGQLAVD